MSDANKPKRKAGRPKAFTPEIIGRICDRFGRGMPLRMACEAEATVGVNEKSFGLHLKYHREFIPQYSAAKAQYLDWAMQQLARNRDWRAVAWHVERRHSDLYGRPAEPGVSVHTSNTNIVNVVPAGVVKRARELFELETNGAQR